MVLRFKIYYLDGGKNKGKGKGKNKSNEYKKLSLMDSVNTFANFANFEEFKKNVEILGNKNYNFEEKDDKENTLIHLAIKYNNLDLIKYLFENNVEKNTENEEGKTPLNLANEEGITPLYLAIENNNLDIINFLIEKGANVNIQDNNGITPLHLAIEINNKITEENEKITKENEMDKSNKITEKNEEITKENEMDKSNEIIKFLIDKSGFNNKNEEGNTQLHLAIINNDLNDIKFLIDKTDLNIKNNNGKTPLQLGFELKNVYILNYIIDQVNKQGENPLLESAIEQSNNEQSKILEELLKLSGIKKFKLLDYLKDKQFEVVKKYFKNLYNISSKNFFNFNNTDNEDLKTLYDDSKLLDPIIAYVEKRDDDISLKYNIFYIKGLIEVQKEKKKKGDKKWNYLKKVSK
jgi:ankyrin repeat protein